MKWSCRLLLPYLLALLSFPLWAQPDGFVRHLEVTGQAEVRANPDQAVVSLGVESWNTDLTAARKDNDGRMARLLAVPPRFGVEAKDVRTDFATIDPQYDMGERGQVRAIGGYRVTKVVTVVVKDLSQVEPFVTAALAAGANRLDRVSFGLADPSKLAAEARQLAVRAAKSKAMALAAELGSQVGKALLITDQLGGGVAPQFKTLNAMAFREGSGGLGDTYAPGQVVVSAEVGVWFELTD